MSTTLLPFLYQTRTLQRLSRTGISTTAFRAFYHPRPRGRSEGRPGRPAPSQDATRSNDIPFELPEDYQHPDKMDTDADGKPLSTITPQERDVFSRIFEEIATRPPPAKSAVPGAKSAADKPSAEQKQFHAWPADSDDLTTRTYEEGHPGVLRNSINIIVQDAADMQSHSGQRALNQPFGPLHPLGQAAAASDWEKALLRFPPSLRDAARTALGTIEANKLVDARAAAKAAALTPEDAMAELIKDKKQNKQPARRRRGAGDQTDVLLDPLAKSVQNEALRREARQHVEARMHAAKTDFALWDVLEADVFPMVQKLGLDETSLAAASSTPLWPKGARKGKGKGKGKGKSEAGDDDTTTPPAPPQPAKLPLDIYGPLYPSYLLTSLRLLDTHFARSSPLALHILPRVKALGPASYVLGVSTPFYNELARIQWSRYGDPHAVLAVLEEMRVAGLYCDEETRAVLYTMEHFFASVGQGKWGPFLREVASLPEYEFAVLPRLRHWGKAIRRQIAERRAEMPA